MSKLDRAKQFLPFDALRGFFELVKENSDEVEERVYLDDDELVRLNEVLSLVKKGDMVKVKHYQENHYIVTEGLVSRINYLEKYIMIVKTKINVNDIINIIIVNN